jgi:tryptophan synthase alpha chain
MSTTHASHSTTATTGAASRVAAVFAGLRQRREFGLAPFVAAGYPDLSTTAALLPALERGGANVIEVGIPFSDPVADGPTVQAAFNAALARGLRIADIFSTIAGARKDVSVPLVAMVSYSIVFRYGAERFFGDAARAGFDGVILPDLPPPEAAAVCRRANGAGLSTSLLVAPTTSAARRKEIAELSTGFIYYLSVSGITGERDRLPEDLEANLRQLRSITERPVCVGFGISRPEHLKQLAGKADGAIVGSAIVKRIGEVVAKGGGAGAIANELTEYCRHLLSRVRD